MSHLETVKLLQACEDVAPIRGDRAGGYTMEMIARLLGYQAGPHADECLPETVLLPVEPHTTEMEVD